MKIQFCDLCNESVPESDLVAGRAQRHKDRVVCAACERSMKGGAEDAAGPRPETGVTQPGSTPSATPPAARSAPSRRGGLGLLAFLLVLILGVYTRGELDELSRAQRDQASSLTNSTTRLGQDLDESTRRGRARVTELEQRIELSLSAQRDASRALIAALSKEVEHQAESLATLEDELERVRTELGAADSAGAQRLDELMAQAMKSREEMDSLEERLRESELAIARGALVPAAAGPAGSVDPQYESELAALKNDSAGVRWNAVQALGETGDPGVITYLVPLLEDPDVFVRMAVARVLGDLAAPEAIEPLIDGLEDEEAVVREASMVALHGITGRNFRFDPVASSAERAKKVKAWRSW